MNKLELWIPVKPTSINQVFGANSEKYKEIGMSGHNGIDFYALDGFKVRAAHDGVVTYAGEDSSGGLTIVIRTHDSRDYGPGSSAFFKTIYCHLKKGTLLVAGGDVVKVGDVIGEADNTGWSTGSHLHFGLKPIALGEQDWTWYNLDQDNGYFGAIDPAPYMSKFFAEDAQNVLSTYSKIIALLMSFLKGRK